MMKQGKNADSCMVLSIPRCGTHVVMQVLRSLGMKEFPALSAQDNFWEVWDNYLFTIPPKGYFCFGNHAYPGRNVALKKANLKGIFISRDPRDWAVSYSFHFRHTSHFQIIYDKYGIDRVLEESIKVIPKQLKRLKWRESDVVYSTTYEKLFQQSMKEFTNICEFLGISPKKSELRKCIQRLKKGAPTYKKNFRKGIVGDWRNYFSPSHINLCKEVCGQYLIDEGYEKNLDW